MSARIYMFCDGCNPKSIRTTHRRQLSVEGNASYNGTINDAVQLGWVVSKQGYTLCPACIKKSLIEMFRDNQLDANELKHYCEKYACK